MSYDETLEPTYVPPEIEDQYEGEWIAWDTETREVVAHHEDLNVVVDGAQKAFDEGHLIYYHHILAPGTVIVGGL